MSDNGHRGDLARHAHAYIRRNFDSAEGCSTGRVAKELGVSRSLLCHRYRQAYGTTMGQEIRRLRIELARRRIREDPTRLVKEVAAEVGFMHSSYRTFLNAFRSETGMSPTQFQQLAARSEAAQSAASRERAAL